MAVIRVKKNKNYTCMSNYHLRDKRLSNKAIGLMCKMLSLPDDWDYSVQGLSAICKDGRDGIMAQLKELEDCGYLLRGRARDSQGRVMEAIYTLFEMPHDAENPITEKPTLDNPALDNPTQLSTKELSTKEIKNNILSSDLDLARKTREIIVYLNEKTKKNYKATTSKTKSLVKARLNDGFSLDDFKKVIDTKTTQWLGNAEMERYLRPETLFGGHFEGYLQEKETEIPVPQKKKIIYEDELMEVDPWI